MGMNTVDVARAVAEGLVMAKLGGSQKPESMIEAIAERLRLAPSGRRRFIREARAQLMLIDSRGMEPANRDLKQAMGEIIR